ncbi:MAG TPA: phosphoribosylanthranilate isomerase [Hyphomicrobium sp.]|nr:phosphoribosylanthranilate isomerase [Hyphomicrobium sp.]
MATEVKICGVKAPEALDAALDSGADYIGLVFFPRSPRHVDAASALKLADRARGQAKIVALFVDPDDKALDGIVEKVQPDMIQLHGDESAPRVREIRSRLHLPVIKAIKVGTAVDAARAMRYNESADLILFDAHPRAGAPAPGGNGRSFDWRALDDVKDRMKFMLSGGLTADNVAQAIAVTHAAAVDVSSGVEREPGVKDPDLIRRFLKAAKTAKHD